MICLYGKMATAFEDNGLCVLDPSVCTVSEETGGSYELYLEHPFDESGKHLMLAEDMIIRAPIPHTVIPSVTLPETIIYTVSTDGPFWKKMPVARHKKAEQDNLSFIRNNSTNYQWNRHKSWNKDSYTVYGGVIYKANKLTNGDQTPLQNPDDWTRMGTVSGSAADDSNYVPGEEYSPAIEVGQRVRRLGAVSDTVIQIRDQLGRVGYYQLSNLTQTTIEAETIPEQVIDEQLFRIYTVESDEETHVIKAYARHISYDFTGNTLLDCKLEDTAVNDAIAVFQGNLMLADDRRIACEFEGNKITKDWSYKNPVNALLDPDDGLVSELKAKLIRNNRDYFILKNTNPRKGPTVEYGVNLQGVTWTRNVETVITRVVPRCSDKADGYIYLESGGTWNDQGVWVANNDIYVDSPIASSYPFPRIEVLDAGFSVGDKYTPAGSKNEIERTTQNCREEMLKQAKERFTVDHCDAPEITLDVEFTLLGDTEQYKQYKDLQRVNLYDQLTIKTKTYEATAQVTSYEFDCLTGRYNSITVGDVSTFNKRVPGYKVVNESITYAKLAPDLISRIRTMDAKSGSSTGSGSSGTPGAGYDTSSTVSPNTKDEAGIVAKGGTNYNKVWGTDSQGNPGWMTGGGVTVNDSNPTLAFGSQSKVGDVGGTDIHVTMPGAQASANTLINALDVGNATPQDDDYTITQSAGGGTSTTHYNRRKMSKVWDYIKDKISSVLGLTVSSYGGKAATAGDADTVNGKTVGTNVPANAVFTDTWNAMTGATSSANGTKGYINATPPKDGYNTKFWGADGTWKVPPGTYSLPLAANGTRGGVQVGYTQSGKNYPVQLSSEKMYVNVPWTDTSGNDKVAKNGDHMSAPLYLDMAEVNASKTNNNVSSTLYPTTLSVQDVANRIIGRAETVVQPDGRIGFNIYARNYNTSGAQIGTARILLYVDKNGDVGYEIDSPDKFIKTLFPSDRKTSSTRFMVTGDNWENGGYIANVSALTRAMHRGSTTNPNNSVGRGIYQFGSRSGSSIPGDDGTNSWGCIENILCQADDNGASAGQTTSTDWLWQWGYNTKQTNPYIRKRINNGNWSSWNMLSSVKVGYGSFTTNANGNVKVTFTENTILLSAWANKTDRIITFLISNNYNEHGGKEWWFHVTTPAATPVAVAETLTIYYTYVQQ